MSIYMVGVDFEHADVDVRSVFAYTPKSKKDFLKSLIKEEAVEGALILSTCNRTELWVSGNEDCFGKLPRWICLDKGLDIRLYKEYMIERKEEEAVSHLFYLTCGLKSQIIGEDQILSQVKDAIAFARELESTDSVLEVLFQKAISSAKKIKTEVYFPKGNASIMGPVINKLEEEIGSLKEKSCLVIGNGAMGRVAAKELLKKEAKVFVTVRKFRHKRTEVVDGCEKVDYEEKNKMFSSCDVIISATSSPHLIINRENLKETGLYKPLILIDLAVPRDIDPEVSKLFGVKRYDMDTWKSEHPNRDLEKARCEAETILREVIADFYRWLQNHNMIDAIAFIRQEGANDIGLRMEKYIKNLALREEEKWDLKKEYQKASERVINKLLFSMREHMDAETFANCIAGLEQVYEDK